MGENKARFYHKLTKWGEKKMNGCYADGYDPNTPWVF